MSWGKTWRVRPSTMLLGFVMVAQVLCCWFAWKANQVMKTQWPKLVRAFDDDSEVYVVQLKRFWGPVHAIVPKKCNVSAAMEKASKELDAALLLTQENGIKNADVELVAQIAGIPDGITLVTTAAPATSEASRDEDRDRSGRDGGGSAGAEPTEEPAEESGATTTARLRTTERARSSGQEDDTAEGRQSEERQSDSDEGRHSEDHGAADTGEEICESDDADWGHQDCDDHPCCHWDSGRCWSSVGSEGCPSPEVEARQLNAISDAFKHHLSRAYNSSRSKLMGFHSSAKERYMANHTLEVDRCNQTWNFTLPSWRHKYLAMIKISDFWNLITAHHGGVHSMRDIHQGRDLMSPVILCAFGICFVMKYSMKVVDIVTRVAGYRYVQLWNNGRTTCDKLIESLLLHIVSIIFTLALQMTYCTLFLTFWHHEYFIMTFIPTSGLFLACMGLMGAVMFMVVDRIMGLMLKFGDWYVWTFWGFAFVGFVFIYIPMIGYSVYSVHYLFSVRSWLIKETIFTPEFVQAASSSAFVSICFLAIAVLDAIAILVIDLDIC